MKIQKIGKRGWFGVILVVIGIWTYITAQSAAKELWKFTWEQGGGFRRVELMEQLARDAGYKSWEDNLVSENQSSGITAIVFGAALIGWGFWKYRSKKGVNPE